uniref:recombinase family protein n=1 Tax=Vibrio cholerae TaxID=666 RepID=UPI00050C4759
MLKLHDFCNRAHTSIEHSRDWCRSLLILNCQELAAQQPLRPINWCSRLLKMTMLAAVARKDYDDRRRRQSQGIAKAKSDGKYNGRQPDLKRHQHIASLLKTGHSYSDIQDMLGCSRHLIATISKNIGSTGQ